MKIRVEWRKCQGNARCWSTAPEVFHLDDEGYIEHHDIDVPEGAEDDARRGAGLCPERVFTIVEE